MAARRDRDGQYASGGEQWYAVGEAARIYRHTFVGVDPEGLLAPIRDAPGFVFVGVAGAAIHAATARTGAGRRRCPVVQAGELTFEYAGAGGQSAVGGPAYLVDDETVTDDPGRTRERYRVGRICAVLTAPYGGQAGVQGGKLVPKELRNSFGAPRTGRVRVLLEPAGGGAEHHETLPWRTVTVPAGGDYLLAFDFSGRGRFRYDYHLRCQVERRNGEAWEPYGTPELLASEVVAGKTPWSGALLLQHLCADSYSAPGEVELRVRVRLTGEGWRPADFGFLPPVRGVKIADFGLSGVVWSGGVPGCGELGEVPGEELEPEVPTPEVPVG
jgi:hypothetical protein